MAIVHPKTYNVTIRVDEAHVTTTIGAAKLCNLYRDILEDKDHEEQESYEFGVAELHACDLPLLKQFLEYHEDHSALDIDHPMKSANESDHLNLFDVSFLRDENNKYDVLQLVRFLNAANYLHCDVLLDVCMVKFICFCATKTIEDVKGNIVTKEFCKQELNRIRKRNEWIFKL